MKSNLLPLPFLLTLASTLASSGTQRGDRMSRYGCEGTTLQLSCPQGELLQVVRANYGRFSLEVCNSSGNTSWSFNCIQHQTKAILDRRCSNLQECTFPVTSELFGGDPCPGTGKYIEVHYQCQSQPTQTSAPPAPPPWLLDLSATPPPRRPPPPPTATTTRPSTTSSVATTPTPSLASPKPTKRQYYVLPPESQSKEGEVGEVEEVEAEQEYLVLGIAVAVSAVVTVLTFLLCYQVWRRCRAKAQSQSRLCQACSCQNVFYSYYESGGSGQTTSTEVKSVAGEECAYQLPYMVVMRPTNHPPTTLGLQAASQAANIYMEIEPGDAIAPLSAPPRPSSAPGPAMLENSPAGSSSILLQQKRRAEGLPGLSPIQIAFNETGQQFLHLNIQPGQERSKL